jgi:hypothetical protein
MSMLLCSLNGAAPGGTVLIVADEWPQMEVLGEHLETRGGFAVEKVEQDALPADLEPYHAVFQYIHKMLKKDPAKALMDYANGGGRLVVLHHGVSSAKKITEGWLPFLGLELDKSKDAEHRYEYFEDVEATFVNLNPGHYITTHGITYEKAAEYESSDQPSVPVTLPAFDLHDTEVYINHQFTDARAKTLLLGFLYEDADSGIVHMQDRAGWLKPTGHGHVFYFQPGHKASDFESPIYAQLILNCLTWERDES